MPTSWMGDVDVSVGRHVETRAALDGARTATVRLQLLGPLTLYRDGDAIELPKSRKVRALIALLALTPRGLSRSALCELLWDSPSDPRGELRWCLSRARAVLDEPTVARLQTKGDLVLLDQTDLEVDTTRIERVTSNGLTTLESGELSALAKSFGGELLEGLGIDRGPQFDQWLGAERRRFRTLQSKVLRALVQKLPEHDPERLAALGLWLQLEPFERIAHELLIGTLVRQGRAREAEEHLAAAIRAFEVEGLEWISIREAWRAARERERTPVVEPPIAKAPDSAPDAAHGGRASICVMPFLEQTLEGSVRSSLGDGLADDIITRLAKLRVLFVIARGTAFGLRERNMDVDEIGRLLKVAYIVTGVVRRRSGRVLVRVELVDTRQPRIVWADEFDCAEDDALDGLDRIGHGIVASIAEEVETTERNRAILKPPSSLNAWEAYHRGLWHMYRFNAADNDKAQHFFRQSAQLDPTFARAHAALSFTHFQNAFLHRRNERGTEADRAYETAGQGLMADDRDPAAHWAMGRALWLRGREDESLRELGLSVELSPNFALGHYTMGFVQSQSGDPRQALGSTDHSRQLSPFDPLLFAMLATQALAYARLGQYDEAATWSMKAAARPNAHVHILSIAASCLSLAGRVEDAHGMLTQIRQSQPGYGLDEFISSFRFTADAEQLLRSAAARIDFN